MRPTVFVLYEVTERDAAALDRYEGVPHYYHRIKVRVRDEEGRLVWALAYKMRADCDDALPSQSYRQTILRGCHEWGIWPEHAIETVGGGDSSL